ncbi:MAG: hypothetical protein ACXU8U_07555 [Asticcacaulis sp.]
MDTESARPGIWHVRVGQRVVTLDAVREGYVIASGDQRVVIDERMRWTVSTLVVLILHLLFLWALIGTRNKIADLPVRDEDIIQAELFTPQPPPVAEVEPVHRPKPVPRQKPRRQSRPLPVQRPQAQQQQAAQQAAPVPAPPAPVPVPVKVLPKIAPNPREDFDRPKTPVLQSRSDPSLQNPNLQAVTLEPEAKTANIKLKKKEEEQLQARSSMTAVVPDAGDLKLHDAALSAVPTLVAPSGLTDGAHIAAGASAPAAGGGGSPGLGADASNGKGRLKGGRGALTQALQDHDYCIEMQTQGKPIPKGCDMKGLGQMAGLTRVLDPHMQKEADRHAFEQRYKTEPGNDAYWKWVNAGPSSQPGPRDDSAPGTYTSPKAQRDYGGLDPDPKSTIKPEQH